MGLERVSKRSEEWVVGVHRWRDRPGEALSTRDGIKKSPDDGA